MKLADCVKPNPGEVPSIATWVIGILWIAVFVMYWFSGQISAFPTPMETIRVFPELWFNEGLGHELYQSIVLNLEAVSIMVLVSLVLAVATVTLLGRSLAVLISSGRFNGFVGLPFVFMAMFHNPHRVKIALLVFGMGVFTLLSLVKMIKNIPKELNDHARTLRMGDWRVVWEIVILGHFDEMIEIFRINIAMGWMMLPMVEGLFKFEGGIGALMLNEQKHLNLDAVFCALIVILIVGLTQDGVIGLFKRIVCPYAYLGIEH
jgi:NitT/TauT family transport system permease protein